MHSFSYLDTTKEQLPLVQKFVNWHFEKAISGGAKKHGGKKKHEGKIRTHCTRIIAVAPVYFYFCLAGNQRGLRLHFLDRIITFPPQSDRYSDAKRELNDLSTERKAL